MPIHTVLPSNRIFLSRIIFPNNTILHILNFILSNVQNIVGEYRSDMDAENENEIRRKKKKRRSSSLQGYLTFRLANSVKSIM